MKILLLANKDIASNLALNTLFQTISGTHEFQILLSSSVGKNNKSKPQPLLDLAFFEQDLFNQILFPALQKNPPLKSPKFQSFVGFKKLGIEVSEIHSINCMAGIKRVKTFSPDLIVSIRFGLILQSAVISIPKFGVINLHSGKLPNYRGVMATFRAMQQNDTEYGSTLHYINDSGIDSGEIISISKQALDYQRSYLYNTLSLYNKGVKDIVNAIISIEITGKCKSYNAHSEGNYFSFPSEHELKDFKRKGLKLYEYQDVIDIAQQYY
ncbi:formyl transferase [uncultured Paraglaciecola sp.]|uniref:formyl transferase n=1 Tax=uncultured Paraglaciecola sp. TaxID=1765024 RepID=UPI0030DA5CB1|tara:strand:+ start:100251 stop:101054 length:804 start_codon:yes stop_codon:yes gene_type:complete